MINIKQEISSRGLDGVFTRATALGPCTVNNLVDELQQVDFDILDRQREALSKELSIDTSTVKPPQLKPSSSTECDENSAACELGEQALRDGRVAIITVAGGQASRLGFNGPKGAFPLGQISGASLFQMLAEQVKLLRQRYSCELPWIVQTGPGNHQDTVDFFSARNWFGMPAPSIHFVCQGVLPALNSKGQFMLTAADKLFANPDGHGGVYRAVKRNRVLEQLRHKNIDLIYYCQVDNPLVFMADPTFIGHHLNSEAQMSVKVVEKTDPAEKVGLVVENSDKIQCVEYSDLSAEIQEQTDSDGGLLLRAGNIAVHCYSLDFFEEMAEAHLPLHLAHKKIKALPPGENVITDVDAVKFETFVFDALPLADRAMVQLADREFEFAPVKNRDGSDSAATSREALSARAKSWLRQIGCDCSASDNALIELSSTIASGPQDLSFRKKQLQTNPQLLVCSCGNKLISLA